jgi:endonuclease/exonuclease/phosphatase family metal-dependent hydrolase
MALLTVATLNLRNRQNRWLRRRKLVVEQLIEVAPDLIALQEVALDIGQGRWLRNQLNWRLSGSARRPYRLVQKRKNHPIYGYLEGVAILSQLPVLSHDSLGLGYGGRVALRTNVELPSGQTIDFVTTHLHHVAHDREARLEQVTRLAGWLNDRLRVPLQIAAGDFNELPDGPAIRRMKQIYRSAFAEKHGYDPLATFPTALVRQDEPWSGCLDYIFLSKAIGPVCAARVFCNRPDAEDDGLYPSDHVGLLASVEVNDL